MRIENEELRKRQSLGFVGRHLFVIVVLLLAFVVRIYHLGVQSLWFDEGWSWHLATLPLTDMATITAGDRSPVLYYALLYVWVELVGTSEFSLRYPSLFADVVTVALVMGVAGLLTRKKGGRAALLYALCPFAIFYAQEARMYALVAMFCTASSYALLRWLQQTRVNKPGFFKKPGLFSRWLAISSVCLALAIHSHYYAVFLLPAHALIVFTTSISNRRAVHCSLPTVPLTTVLHWCIATACVVLSVLPWLLFARGGFAYDDGFVFPLNTITGRMMEWLRSFANGGFGYALPEGWVWAVLVVMGLGLMGFVLARRWREALWLAVLVVAPLLAATVAVRVVYPYRSVFHPRYLIYIAPMACVLLASVRPNIRVARYLFFLPFIFYLLLALPALQSYITQPNPIRDDYRAAARHVVEGLEPGDVVVMTRDNYAIRYYWPPTKASVLLAAPQGLHGVLKPDGLNKLVMQLRTQSPNRVRLMLWQDNVVDAQKLSESLFWANGYQIGEINFGQIRMPLYQIQQSPLQPLAFTPANKRFGDTLELKSFWMRRQAWASDWFYLVLEWQPIKLLSKDYKVFVHVLDATGQIKFQKDKLAIDELRPMSSWAVGDALRDPYAIVIPTDLPIGDYRVMVGVYDPVTGQRLTTAEGDSVTLGIFRVIAR